MHIWPRHLWTWHVAMAITDCNYLLLCRWHVRPLVCSTLRACPMRNILYLIAGIVFGVVLTKTEAISWFRIQEMFRFDSFHMYGIFMTAIPTAAIGVLLIKKLKLHSLDNAIIEITEKKF